MLDILAAGLVPMLHSSPGMGKSDLVRTIAKKFNLLVIDMRLSQMDPTDLNGFPTMNVDKTRSDYVPPMTIPLEGDPIPEGYKGWILFLDEITSAPPGMQAAGYKLILDRLVGQRKVHKQCAMVAAGNLSTDKAITNRMSTALQSRMIHLVMEVCPKSWNTWGVGADIDYRVLGFLRFRPDLLHKFDPNHDELTFACPRTYEFVSRIIKPWKSIPTDKVPLLAGTIGQGAAIELKAFVDIFSTLPEAETIRNDPHNAVVPHEPGTLYAVTALLGNIIDASNMDSVMNYVERLPKEFQAVALQGVWKKDPTLADTTSGKSWITRNAEEMI